MSTYQSAMAGPARAARILAPDLARGATLLFIAVANSACVFLASTPGADPNPTGAERPYTVALFSLVHARALPLFVLLFGYGLVQFHRNRQASGIDEPAVRRMLLRRNLWMLVIGAAHGILLFSGDILGAYSLVGAVFTVLLLRRGDRFHRWAPWYLVIGGGMVLVTGGIVVAGLVFGDGGTAGAPIEPWTAVLADDFGTAVRERLLEWPITTVTFLGFALWVWLGVWAARKRILEDAGSHLRLLRVGAIGGLTIGIAGGLPMGLLAAGYIRMDETGAAMAMQLYQGAGFFGGIGYLSLFGLIAHRLATRTGGEQSVVVSAITALGRRSLSGYLFQSVAWLVLASPYLLDLGTGAGSPSFMAFGCAVGVWVISVIGAEWMHRRRFRGPAELLLRRLAFGRPAPATTAASVTGTPAGGRNRPRSVG